MKWAPSKGFGCWFLFSSTKAKTTVWPQQEAYSASEVKLGIMQFFFFFFLQIFCFCKRIWEALPTYIYLWVMLTSVFKYLLTIQLNKVFMEKKSINILTIFFIFYKSDVKIYLKWIVN